MITDTQEKLLCTDLDGTLIGGDDAMYQLLALIKQNNIRLVFSTGRDLASVNQFVAEKNIQKPAHIICLVGTQIYFLKNNEFVLDENWSSLISEDWQRDKIAETLNDIEELTWQDARWQTEFKISYYLTRQAPKAVPEIKKRLSANNLAATVIYSGNKFLDILPPKSGKGHALKYLANKLGIEQGNVIVSGDSGNDLALFQLGFNGIIVGNVSDELKNFTAPHVYHADQPYSAGIIEGLKHFSFI